MTKRLGVGVLVFLLVFWALPKSPVSAAPADSILISEVRLGGADVALPNGQNIKEYVSIYNAGTAQVELSGWFIEYAKNPQVGLDAAFCDAGSWVGFSNVMVTRIPLAQTIDPNEVIVVDMQLNDSGSGSVRLVDDSEENTTTVHDVVGWGSSAPCKEATVAPTPSTATGESIFRFTDCEETNLVDMDDNSKDFTKQLSSPGGTGPKSPTCVESTDEDNCDIVLITEILPSVSGTDEGKEFIELHNPTDTAMSLYGCRITVTGLAKEYIFAEDVVLGPYEYKAFYDELTTLVLPNSAATELLIVSEFEEFAQTSYPADIKEDYSWALFDGGWAMTNKPTPNSTNEPSVLEVVQNQTETLEPCPVGKFRNPATNRCKSITVATAKLALCDAGQFRNPDTNRCKSLASTASSLVPCKQGQERNPETNRCRKVDSAADTLKACDKDEERNPETNRCRKVQATLASADTASKSSTEPTENTANYAVLGVIGASVAGYGAFEYRNDIRNKLASLKSRFFSSGK